MVHVGNKGKILQHYKLDGNISTCDSRVFAHLSHCLGVCVSVRLSHSAALSKRCKLRSWNLHCGPPKKL